MPMIPRHDAIIARKETPAPASKLWLRRWRPVLPRADQPVGEPGAYPQRRQFFLISGRILKTRLPSTGTNPSNARRFWCHTEFLRNLLWASTFLARKPKTCSDPPSRDAGYHGT